MANINISSPIFDASEFPLAPQMPGKSGQGGEGFEQFLQKADAKVFSHADDARTSSRPRSEQRPEPNRSGAEKSSPPEKTENFANRPADDAGKADEKRSVPDAAKSEGASGEAGKPSEQAGDAPKAGDTPAQSPGQELPVGVTVAAENLNGLFAILPAGLQQQAEGGDFGKTPLGEALTAVTGEGAGQKPASPEAGLSPGPLAAAGNVIPEGAEPAVQTAGGQGVSQAAQDLLFGGKLPAAASEGEVAEGPRPVSGPAVAEAAHESLAKGVLPGNGPAASGSGDGSGTADGEAGKSGNTVEALLRERPVNASGEQMKTAKEGVSPKEQYTSEMAPLAQKAMQAAYSERAIEVRAALFGTGGAGDGEPEGLLEMAPVSRGGVGETLGVRGGDGGPLAANGDVSGKNNLPPDVARAEAHLRHEAQRQVFEAAIARMGIAIQNKVARARIQLNPPELGRVDMELRVESGVLNARVRVEHGWVKETIESNLKTLRDSLQEQGITVESFTVDVKTGDGSGSFAQLFDHESGHGLALGDAGGDEEGVLELAAVGEAEGAAGGDILTPGSVNLFA